MSTKTEVAIYVSPITVQREKVLASYLAGEITRDEYLAEEYRLSEEQFAETTEKAKPFLASCDAALRAWLTR
jgi:hypothetical protein